MASWAASAGSGAGAGGMAASTGLVSESGRVDGRLDGLGFGFVLHALDVSGEVQGGRDVHFRVTIRPDRDHGHFAQGGLGDVVERRFVFDAVDGAGAFLHQLRGFDLGADGELPGGTGLRLRNDGVGDLAVRHDLAFDGKVAFDGLGAHHADAAERVVLVVGEERDLLRHRHAGEVDHDRLGPAPERHLPAAVGDAGHFGVLAAGGGGRDFEELTRPRWSLVHAWVGSRIGVRGRS